MPALSGLLRDDDAKKSRVNSERSTRLSQLRKQGYKNFITMASIQNAETASLFSSYRHKHYKIKRVKYLSDFLKPDVFDKQKNIR